MPASVEQRERLSRFVDLARVYRGWTRSELSDALGRDPSKLVPESGNPKLDLLVGIADALDWTVGDVAESVWKDTKKHPYENADLDFSSLLKRLFVAHRSGQWAEMLAIGQAMLRKSTTSDERAASFAYMSVAYDGMGRYANALKTLQQGMTEHGVSDSVLLMLRANLANAHYALWNLVEARAISGEVIEQMPELSRSSRRDRVMAALSRYVRANTLRRMIAGQTKSIDALCARAREDLKIGQDQYLALAEEFDDDSFRGVANTCAGALIEINAAQGMLDPLEAAQEIDAGLESVVDPSAFPAGDQLESWGWWAIFGCNIALRHLEGDSMHRHMAVFTNKAIEIADRLGNWSMRERAFTLEHFRRQQADLNEACDQTWQLDDEDIRVITGTMGRFPSFREVGWQILRGARVLDAT